MQQTKITDGGIVTACFSAQKVTVLGYAAGSGWIPQQLPGTATVAVVRFTKGSRVITVIASWSGGPQWQVTDTQ
jgi:hypothetical protein